MILLLIALFLTGPNVELGPAKKIELFAVPSEVYEASYRASGAKLCDRTLRQAQELRFDKRFGTRVSKLISVLSKKEQEPSGRHDLIVTSSCIGVRDKDEAKEALSRALDDFGPTLDAMERRYGISQSHAGRGD